MLSKKDLENIRGLIQEELKALVFRDIVMECGPKKPGDPEGKTQKEMTVNILDMMAEYLPRTEGALRGVQADINTCTNTLTTESNRIEAMGNALLSFQTPIMGIANIAAQLEQPKFRLIEGDK